MQKMIALIDLWRIISTSKLVQPDQKQDERDRATQKQQKRPISFKM
jgi:hypothetical protein